MVERVYEIPDHRYGNDETFSVVRCKNCGLGFVSPRPIQEDMHFYYPGEFYQGFDVEHEYHERRYALESDLVMGAVRSGGRRLIDVGCANGDFPRFMRTRGWEVEGVEVSSGAKPISDFKVWHEDFSSIPIDGPSFDAITAWAVLEHVHDPLKYFLKAGRLLKPGAAFVFLVTNFDSVSSRALFREDVPRHLFFFTEPTVRKYLDLAGLEFVSADYSDRIYAMRPINWLRYYLEARARGRQFTWGDSQYSRAKYLAMRGISPSMLTTTAFLLTHPHFVADRLLLRAYERLQMLTRRYGIVTYVARKLQ